MTLRPFIFWSHLVAGVLAGTVILIMSATGVLLMYERQIVAWSDRHYRSTAPSPNATCLSMEAIAAKLTAAQPDLSITAITINAAPDAPITIAAGRRTVFVDAYSGAVLGESSRGGIRRVLSTVREWHRWFAVGDENRPIARAITGWSNALFLFIVMSGLYIWLPRIWTQASVRAVALFNGRLRGKARDFNWHNVIGVWCCVPLFFVVLTAMPISFPWASALVFRAVGETPPAAGERPSPERPRGAVSLEGMDALWVRAASHQAGWRTITLRLPTTERMPMVFTIDRGDGGQPQLRSTLTLDRRSGEVVRWETFASQSLGRRLRSLSRFTHTGEVLGLTGQTIAGLVSGGAVVLVWTGLALALRRFRAWVRRRTQAKVPTAEEKSHAA